MNFEYETPRLHLRILNGTLQNARQVLDFYKRNRSVLEKYEPLHPRNFYTEKYHMTLLNCEYQMFLHVTNIRFWIYDKQNPHTIIGTVCFYNFARSIFQHCDIGYKLDERYWHQGYAKEALSFLIARVFKELNMHRIQAYVMTDNINSIHLLESLGFQKEGLCRQSAKIQDKWTDHLLYSLINEI